MDDFKKELESFIENTELEFKPTQNKISLPIVYRIYNKMQHDIKFDAIKVCDNLVIDGHHRFIASRFANVEIERFPTNRGSCQATYDWKDVSIVINDYDDESLIRYHDYNDAYRNNLTVAELKIKLNK